MPSDNEPGFALYPMVEEAAATGVVATVYAALQHQMPFVPSLFKSLALCPPYLVLAYQQAAGVVGTDDFAQAATSLADSVHGEVSPPDQPEVRATLAQFAQPLSRMLLLGSGLQLALHDQLDTPPASGAAPSSGPVDLSASPATPRETPAQQQLYTDIRATLQTPIINSVWRRLAERGQLAAAWSALGPHAKESAHAAPALRRRALDAARGLDWPVGATPAALAGSGVPDAAPGAVAVLDAYLTTLPRVLVLVASAG